MGIKETDEKLTDIAVRNNYRNIRNIEYKNEEYYAQKRGDVEDNSPEALENAHWYEERKNEYPLRWEEKNPASYIVIVLFVSAILAIITVRILFAIFS